MITVFGATGTVGGQVVAALAEAGHRVRAFVRNPSAATLPAGVEVFRGDLDAPETVSAALAGASAVFVLTTGPNAAKHDLTIADALRDNGIGRVVRLSSIAAKPPVDNSYAELCAEAERVIRSAAPRCTVLRPAGFMSNVLQWLPMIAAGEVRMPFGEIPRALIDPADIGAVAARVLTEDGHAGRDYPLTGPQALTTAEQVDRLAAAIRRPVRFVPVSAAEARAAMTGNGMPPNLADGMLASLADPDPARGAEPTPDVERITGRLPGTFDAWLAAHATAFDRPGFDRST